MPSGSTGLLIIRAYVEAGSPVPLRAEIRLTSDVSTGFEQAVTLADRDLVARVVRDWLDKILEGPTSGSGRHVALTPRR
jgi:hypothetical protein